MVANRKRENKGNLNGMVEPIKTATLKKNVGAMFQGIKNEREKIKLALNSDIERKKRNIDSIKAIGKIASVGAIAGSFIPVVGPVIGVIGVTVGAAALMKEISMKGVASKNLRTQRYKSKEMRFSVSSKSMFR